MIGPGKSVRWNDERESMEQQCAYQLQIDCDLALWHFLKDNIPRAYWETSMENLLECVLGRTPPTCHGIIYNRN
jgi:hypothetical protein